MTSPTINPQHVLILGAGPGLSASIARRFGREGFEVTLVARRERALGELAAQLREAGITTNTFTADAADPRGFRKALECLAQRSSPSVVVYNAVFMASDSILTSDTDYLLSTYAVDVLGAVSAAQVFTPAMRQAGTGTATSLLHDELKADGVHVAGITIAGAIASGTLIDPDRIADTYWALHMQPVARWSAETLSGGQS